MLHDLAWLVKVEVSVDLLVVLPLAQVAFLGRALLLDLARVDGVEGASRELVQVAGDDLRTFIHIGHHKHDLALVAQVPQIVYCSLPDAKGVE